jgi:hypothetical protein
MADGINLPSNLYTAGAVPIDIQQGQNFATQLALKQQAREDSLNEYFQNTAKDINPEGIRAQDTPGFMDKYNAFTDFYAQNRQAIQNPRLDGGQALAEYNSRHQDMLGYAEQSKNAQAVHQELWKAKSNPATSYMFNTPDAIPAIQAHELPLNDPGHKPLDLDEMRMNAQPLGVKDLNAIHTGLLKDMQRTPTGNPVSDGQGNAYQAWDYSPQAKQDYLTRAQHYYISDPKIRYSAQGIVNDPNRYAQAQNAFLKITGRTPNNEAELYAGEQAAMDGLDVPQQKKVSDFQARSNLTENRMKSMADYNQTKKINLMGLANDLSLGKTRQQQQDDYDRINNYAQNLIDVAKGGKGINVTDENGKPVTEYTIHGGQALNKFYTKGNYDTRVEPSAYRAGTDENGDYVRIIYADGSTKKIPKDSFVGDIGKAIPKIGTKPVPPPVSSSKKPVAQGDLDGL